MKIKLALEWFINPDHLPFIVGLDKGLYKNNLVWIQPSKNEYGTPVVYSKKPHVDGYISKNIRQNFLPKAAPVVVSSLDDGRVILFAENQNFRGTAYGTNRMFLNALFLGEHITVPKDED